jgi:TPR repeat protein
MAFHRVRDKNLQRLSVLALSALALSVLALSALASCAGPKSAATPKPAPVTRPAANAGVPAACDGEGACLAAACERGEAKECLPAAKRLRGGEPGRFGPLLELGCAKQDEQACSALADELVKLGDGLVDYDATRSAALRERACARGRQEECVALAWMLFRGKGLVVKDERRAFELLRRACALGNIDGCTGYAKEGPSVDRDPIRRRGFELQLEACKAGELGRCWGAYEERRSMAIWAPGMPGVPDETWRALVARTGAACDRGDAEACVHASKFAQEGVGRDRSPEDAKALTLRACTLGGALSCAVSGIALEATEPEHARALYGRACTLGEGFACARLARGETDPARIVELSQRACDLGHQNTCSDLARRLERGDGVPADPARARGLAELLCRRGWTSVCLELADAEPQPERALALHERACSQGDFARGCTDAAVALRQACDAGDRAPCERLQRLLAQLSPARRDVVRVACCAGDPGVGATPLGRVTAFRAALARGDLAAVRGFVHPKRPLVVRLEDRDNPEDNQLSASTLTLADLARTSQIDPNGLDCPETFAATETTCTQHSGEQHESYTLAWIDGRSWLVEIVEAGRSP